jgi:hypothetical protein
MRKLRDQMLVDLQLSGAKPRTQKTCLREVENLAKYFNRYPEELGEDELKEYMLYLMKERHLSEGTFRFYVAALKFLYRTTLKREWVVEKIKCPRAKRKLPVVLDHDGYLPSFAVITEGKVSDVKVAHLLKFAPGTVVVDERKKKPDFEKGKKPSKMAVISVEAYNILS